MNKQELRKMATAGASMREIENVIHMASLVGFDGEVSTRLRYTKRISTTAWIKFTMGDAKAIAAKKAHDLVIDYWKRGIDAKISCSGQEVTRYSFYVTHN